MTPEALINKDKNIVYDYEYFQQDDVCRLCWNKNAKTDLFIENINEITDKNIVNKIKECLEIDLSGNLFPKKLCAYCYQQIDTFYIFKVFCQDTDKKLREIVKTHFKPSVGGIETVKIEKVSNEGEINLFGEFKNIVQNSDASKDGTQTENCIKSERERCKKKTPTYCKICRIDLDNTVNFVLHNSEYHGVENGLFKCLGCEKKFKSRKTRLSHEYNFCKGLADGYKCSSCTRFLPSRRHYETHMRNHRENISIDLPEDIFKCRHCFKLFKTKDDLNKHVPEHGAGQKNFVCENCGRVFKRQDYLHKHKLTHTGEKQHVCPHCNFRTTQRSSLVVHIRKHTGERPYSCDVCPQRCVSSSNLRAHRRRHLGIKPHECTICGKRFGYKMTLAEHVCAAHAPAPQPCPLCAAKYTRARALARHMRAKHPQHQPEQQLQPVQQLQSVLQLQPVQQLQQLQPVQQLQPEHTVQPMKCVQPDMQEVQCVQRETQQAQSELPPVQCEQHVQPVQCGSQQMQSPQQLQRVKCEQPVQQNVRLVQRDPQPLMHREQQISIPSDLRQKDAT